MKTAVGISFVCVLINKKHLVARNAFFLNSYPVHCAKVDSFSKVETLVESTVISSGERDDKLACTLVGTIDLVIRRTEGLLCLLIYFHCNSNRKVGKSTRSVLRLGGNGMLQLCDQCDDGENVYRHAVVHQGVGIHNGD